MKIKITTTNIDLTDALSSFVEEKMKHLDKLLKNDISADSVLCEVEIGINTKHHHSGKIFRAEINLHISGKILRVASEKEDLYIAINDAKEELKKSLTSYQSKQRTRFRRGTDAVKNIIKGFKKGD
ncbi:ribosome-associated translation inhibitor RaiA [Patescibacteria group bacterium]|nr:ribosome-associated translation inhibitor RaiA [Patescibacteria group bacterium]